MWPSILNRFTTAPEPSDTSSIKSATSDTSTESAESEVSKGSIRNPKSRGFMSFFGLKTPPAPTKPKTPKPRLVPLPPLKQADYIKVSSNAGLQEIYPNLMREVHEVDFSNTKNPAYKRDVHAAMNQALDESVAPFDRKVFLAPQVLQNYEERVPGIMALLLKPENHGVLHTLQQNPELKEKVLQALERPWWFAEVKATPHLLQRMVDKPDTMSEIVPPTINSAKNKTFKSTVLSMAGKNEPPAALAARMQRDIVAYQDEIAKLQGTLDDLTKKAKDFTKDKNTLTDLAPADRAANHDDQVRGAEKNLAVNAIEIATVESTLLKARALSADRADRLDEMYNADPKLLPPPATANPPTAKEAARIQSKIRNLDNASMARLKIPATLVASSADVSDLNLRATDGVKHGALKSMLLRHKHRKEAPDAQYTRLSGKVEIYKRAIQDLNRDIKNQQEELEMNYRLHSSLIDACNDPKTATEKVVESKNRRSAEIASGHAKISKLETLKAKMTSLRDHTQHEMDVVQALHPDRTAWSASPASIDASKVTSKQVAHALKKADKLKLNQAVRDSDLALVWLQKDPDIKASSNDDIMAHYVTELEKAANDEPTKIANSALEKMESLVDPQTLQFKRDEISTFATLLDREGFPQLPADAPPQLKALRMHISAHLWEITQAAKKIPPLSEANFGYALRDQFAAIAEKSALIYGSFRGTPSLRFENIIKGKDVFVPTYRDANGKRDAGNAAHFGLMTVMAGELKRRALKETVVAGYDEAVKQQVAQLKKDVPRIDETVSGTNFSTATGANVIHSFLGFLNLEVGYTQGYTGFRDDDTEIDVWHAHSPYVKFGLGQKFGSWAFSASLSYEQEGGRLYLEKQHLEPCLKLLQNWHANKAWQTSCSPKARAFMTALATAYDETAKESGMRLHDTTSASTDWFSDAKVAKGYNDARLRRIAERVDHHVGNSKLSSLINKAFPSVSDSIKDAIAEGSELPKDSLREAIPDSEPKGHGAMPYRHSALTGDVNFGIALGPNPNAQFGFGADVQLEGDRMQFHVESVDAGHDLLNTGYHKDVSQTFMLHNQIDALLNKDGNPRTNPPKLHLYTGIKNIFEDATAMPQAPNFAGEPDQLEQLEFYLGKRPEADELLNTSDPTKVSAKLQAELDAKIPPQFRASMTEPTPEKLDAVTVICRNLAYTYADFVENTQKFLYSKSTVSKRNSSPALDELRELEQSDKEAAFDAINSAIWNNSYPGGMKAAMKKPELFIQQTHDAISLALGDAGTHLSILQQEAVRKMLNKEKDAIKGGDPEVIRLVQNNKAALADDIHIANGSYNQCRTALENGYLGMRKEVVVDKGTLENRALWERFNIYLQAKVTAGSQFGILSAIAKSRGTTVGDWQDGNELGQVTLLAKLRFQKTTHQINPSRLGTFFELTLTASAGVPLAEKAVTKMVTKAMEKMYPGTKAADMEIQIASAVRDIMQAAAVERNGGTSIVVKWRKPADSPGIFVDPRKYDLQYVRVLENKNTGISIVAPLGQGSGDSGVAARQDPGSLSIAFPLPVGHVTLGLVSNEARQSTVFEIKGHDLSYQMMQFGQYRAVMEQMKAVNDPANPDNNRPKRSLAEVLLGKRDATNAVLEPATREAQEVGVGYFGSPHTISTPVDRYITYQTLLAKWDGKGKVPPELKQNEYYKLFQSRAALIAAKTKHHAAGSTDDPFTAPLSLKDQANVTYAETVGNIDKASGNAKPTFDWEAERAYISTLKTAQERVEYFSGPDDPKKGVGGHGETVRKIFEEIVGAAKQINSANMLHVPRKNYGFWTSLRDKKESAQAANILGMQNDKADGVGEGKFDRTVQSVRTLVSKHSAEARKLDIYDLRTRVDNNTATPAEIKELARRDKPKNTATSTTTRFTNMFSRDDSKIFVEMGKARTEEQLRFFTNPQLFSRKVTEAAEQEIKKLTNGELPDSFYKNGAFPERPRVAPATSIKTPPVSSSITAPVITPKPAIGTAPAIGIAPTVTPTEIPTVIPTITPAITPPKLPAIPATPVVRSLPPSTKHNVLPFKSSYETSNFEDKNGQKITVLFTGGAGNCGFNSVAQALIGLANQSHPTITHEFIARELGLDVNVVRNLKDRREIEDTLHMGLRRIAVDALANRKDLIRDIEEQLLDNLAVAVYKDLKIDDQGEPGALIDGGMANPLAKKLLELTPELVRRFAKEKDKDVIQQYFDDNKAKIKNDFQPAIKEYMNYMKKEGIFATDAELTALAGRLGIQLTIFAKLGKVVNPRDTVPPSRNMKWTGPDLSTEQIKSLKNRNVIDEYDRRTKTISVRGLSEADIKALLTVSKSESQTTQNTGNAFRDRFLGIYNNQFSADAQKVKIGMYHGGGLHYEATVGPRGFELT